MNHRIFSALACVIILFCACSKDKDDDSCIQTDFVGTYTGTNICEGEAAEDATVSITEAGGDLFFVDDDGEEFPIETNGCNLSIPTLDLIFAEVGGTGTLEGDKITISLNLSAFGFESTCTFEGSK